MTLEGHTAHTNGTEEQHGKGCGVLSVLCDGRCVSARARDGGWVERGEWGERRRKRNKNKIFIKFTMRNKTTPGRHNANPASCAAPVVYT